MCYWDASGDAKWFGLSLYKAVGLRTKSNRLESITNVPRCLLICLIVSEPGVNHSADVCNGLKQNVVTVKAQVVSVNATKPPRRVEAYLPYPIR